MSKPFCKVGDLLWRTNVNNTIYIIYVVISAEVFKSRSFISEIDGQTDRRVINEMMLITSLGKTIYYAEFEEDDLYTVVRYSEKS